MEQPPLRGLASLHSFFLRTLVQEPASTSREYALSFLVFFPPDSGQISKAVFKNEGSIAG